MSATLSPPIETAEPYPERLHVSTMKGSYHDDLNVLWLEHGPKWLDVVHAIAAIRAKTPGGWTKRTKAWKYFDTLTRLAREWDQYQRETQYAAEEAERKARDARWAKSERRAERVMKLLPALIDSNDITTDQLLALLVQRHDAWAASDAEGGHWSAMNTHADLAHKIEKFRQEIE